ncbi:DUF222 domain-containing protein [Kytococcus sedentarius]|uniref:DUF222 domain-containing protein n=1 Tax=Kytococcus sedentarius TaxID=1276 RepID=UPI0038795703
MEDLFYGLRAAPPAPPGTAPGPIELSPSAPDTGLGPREEMDSALAQADAATTVLIAAMARLGAHPEALDTAYLERLLHRVQTLANRYDRLRVRALDVVRVTREAGNAHHDDDAQYTAGRTRTNPRQAGRDADLARALGNHKPTPPAEPEPEPSSGQEPPAETAQSPTAVAWDAGAITRDHALIITRALDDLPDHLSDEQRLTVEVDLVDKAQRLSPARLRKAAQRALGELDLPQEQVDAHHNELVRNEESAAWEAANFWIADRGDGTMYGQFTLPVLQGRMLEKALHALTSPRRLAHKKRARAEGTGLEGASWKDTQIDWAHERGKALAELINHLPTDKLGSKVNAILLVTTDLETLRGETDRAGVTDTGDTVSAEQTRHLAANAGIIPLVMDGASQPLDLGRQRRFFTDTQRAALATKYTSCAERDCDRPFAWCEIHHDRPFHPRRGPDGELLHPGGGRTDHANGIPLCGPHHHRTEDPHYTYTTTRDERGAATVTFSRRRPGDPGEAVTR